jgi:hypothetical protein
MSAERNNLQVAPCRTGKAVRQGAFSFVIFPVWSDCWGERVVCVYFEKLYNENYSC